MTNSPFIVITRLGRTPGSEQIGHRGGVARNPRSEALLDSEAGQPAERLVAGVARSCTCGGSAMRLPEADGVAEVARRWRRWFSAMATLVSGPSVLRRAGGARGCRLYLSLPSGEGAGGRGCAAHHLLAEPRRDAAVQPELLGATRRVPVALQVSAQLLLRGRGPLRGDMQRVQRRRFGPWPVVVCRRCAGCLRGRRLAARQGGEQRDGGRMRPCTDRRCAGGLNRRTTGSA